jgi:PAS domain S-box-containing protein
VTSETQLLPRAEDDGLQLAKPSSALFTVARYGMALFLVATALLWSYVLHPFLANAFLVLFLVAAMASGWLGREGPGLFAALLSSLAVDYFFFPPVHTFRITLETVPYFLSFFLSAVAASWLSAARRRADDQQRAHLDELFEQAPEAIMLLDLETHAVRINKEFSRLFGYASSEILGSPGMDFIVPPELRVQAAHSHECLARGETVSLETVRKRKDGSSLFVSELAVPIIVNGRHISDYVIFRDITESKRAAESLQRAQAELAHLSRVTTMGELVASIAHEVNQPIGGVVANGSAAMRWLSVRPPDIAEAQEALTSIIRDANRAAAVIRRIRAFLEKTPPRLLKLDLNDVIRGVLLLTERELHSGGVVLLTDLAADLPPVSADRVQLQQVMLNLIMNGVDAMTGIQDRPRELFIKSSADSDCVMVEVRDSGVGLNVDEAERVFEPFFTTKAQGLGMGLSISRSIVESHGGRLWVVPQSSPGADFRFTLPMADGAE